MARTQVGGIRTVGAREAAGVEPDLPSPVVDSSGFKHVFQSRKAALFLSLKRRRVHWHPDGTKEEEIPTSENGSRLDMVRFNDHFFRTNDDEVAAAIQAQPAHIYGVDGLCWRAADLMKRQRDERAAQIRAALAADPDLAKAVVFTPSEKSDWNVKPKGVAVQPINDKEMSEEELDRLTNPNP